MRYYLNKEKPSSQSKTQTEGRNLDEFPVAAVANYHRLSGLKHQLSSHHPGGQKSEMRREVCLPSGESASLPFPASRGHLCSMTLGPASLPPLLPWSHHLSL